MPLNHLDYRQEGMVIFCGAGVSMVPPTCLPSWWQLNQQVLQQLSQKLIPLCGEKDADDLAEQIKLRREDQRFPPEYQAEIIAKHYGKSYFEVLKCLDGDQPNEVHCAIAALAGRGYVKAVVTTNFDRLFELAFKKMGVPLDVNYEGKHFKSLSRKYHQGAQDNRRCQLLKIHGSVEDADTLVDTLSQRMRGLPIEVCSCLRYLIRGYHWLFMGYSGADLESDPQYLCLQAEVNHAKGFTWLVRENAKDEPIEAVSNLCAIYGARSQIIRGELPSWISSFFNIRLPKDLSFKDETEAVACGKNTHQRLVAHAGQWADRVGPFRAAIVIADILETSVSNPQAAMMLLEKILKREDIEETHYIAAANSLANILRKSGKLDDARDIVNQALQKLGSNNQKHRLALLGTMGLIEQSRGNFSAALHSFEEMYQISENHMDATMRSVALHNRAMALSSMGQLDQAVLAYTEILQLEKDTGDALAQAKAWNNLGELYRELARYDESIKASRNSIDIRERLGDDRGVAYGLGNIATVYQRKGDLRQAQMIYDEISSIFAKINDRQSEIITLYNLAGLYSEVEDYDQAEERIQSGKQLAIKLGFNNEEAKGLWMLGQIYRQRQRYPEAKQLYHDALNQYAKQGNLAGEADVLNEIGNLFYLQKKFSDAKDFFSRSKDIYERLGKDADQCNVISNIALVYREEGNPTKALDCLFENLAFAEKIGSNILIAAVHYKIAAILNDLREIDKAVDHLNAAQELYQKTEMTFRAFDILVTMGEIRGHQGRLKDSMAIFDEARRLLETDPQKDRLVKSLEALRTFLHQQGHGEHSICYSQMIEELDGLQLAGSRRPI